MDPREKLKGIQQQKKKLHERINQIDKTDLTQNKNDQKELNQLLIRKKMLEDQKKKQEEYQALQKEYNQRKKQVERQKQLERIKNQKRIIQLQAAMKKVVFEGIKEKVKGMNSQQLMMKGYLANGDNIIEGKPLINSQSSNFKEAFQGYLLKDGPEKLKPKYNINNLNEKRLQIYQKKEQLIMKQILLKELSAIDQPIQMDVLSLTKQQLKVELQKRHIDFEDYMHPVKKEDVIDHYQMIKNQAQDRINEKKKNILDQKADKQAHEKYKKQLKEDIRILPYKSIQVVKRLLYDLFDQVCNDYDKRHVNRSKQDKEQIAKKLQEEYDDLWNRNLVEQLSNTIIDNMIEDMRKQMIKESAQEIAKLNEFAHQKTEQCFKGIFGQGNIVQTIQQLNNYKFGLNFIDEDQKQISKPKNDQYMKKMDNSDNNVFQTEQNTVNLVNDILLLSEEEKYMKNVKSLIKNQTDYKTEDALFYYDKELYSITTHNIKGVFSKKTYHTFNKPLAAVRALKINKNWIIESQKELSLITPWNKQQFGCAMGGRISNPCGNFAFSCLYPVMTLLGSFCSVMIGFQKGQILKYNYNLNRLTSKQTNITQYIPAIQHTKSGDQPSFPLDNRNYIPVITQKPKPTDQIHQFREFFEHHSDPIIFIQFYRVDKMISIDRALKCALWQYGRSRGTSSFQPVFKFQIKSSYEIYKEDQNPRYKDIFPTSSSTETPEDMYQKYMLTETFLKLQLYNNPKKQIAYFKSPSWQKDMSEKAIWKITYKDSRKQVNKILQSYYNAIDGSIIAQQAKIINDAVYVLCEREHIIRNDLKTIKLYSWSILEKRLGRVGLEIDMYKDQKVSNFVILPNGIRGVQMQLAVIVNSGRILMFSLVSGQLLKNINEDMGGVQKQRYYFKTIINAADQQFLYGIATNKVLELHLQDNNSISDKNKLNKTIDNVRRKFFR